MSNKRENKIISDNGDWLEVDVSTPKHPGAVMKIDKADWSVIKTMFGRCCAWSGSSAVYAVARVGGKVKTVHGLIVKTKLDIDHINHDGLDNRRSNLRVATRTQNNMNRKPTKLTSSGVFGVYRNHSKWRASMKVGGVKVLDETFDNLDDAVLARKRAEDVYQGEFKYRG